MKLNLNKNIFNKIKFIFTLLQAELIKFRVNIILGSILIIIVTLISYLFPRFSIIIFDDIIPQKKYELFYAVLGLLALLYLLNGLMTYWYQKIFFMVRESIGNSLQLKIFSTFNYLDYPDFESIEENDRYAYVTRDVNNIKTIFDRTVINFIKNIFSFLIGIFLMFTLQLYFTFVILFVLLAFAVISYYYSRIIKCKEETLSKLFGKVLQSVMSPLYRFLPIRIYNIFNLFRVKLSRYQADYLSKSFSLFRLRTKLGTAQTLIGNILVLFIFLFAGIQIMSGVFTLGKLIGYNFYLSLVLSSFFGIITFHLNFQATAASINRLQKFLNLTENQQKNLPDISKAVHSIIFKEVSFQYPSKKNDFCLNSISFEVKAGEILAIIGENGSGKTTILKLLLGIYSDYDGLILLNGQPLNNFDLSRWRDKIGFVPQENFFIDGSLKENIILTEKYMPKKFNEIIRLCGLESYIEFLDRNVDSLIKSNEVFLSGGYQQRVAIARALYKEPELIVYDEATSQLDPYAEYENKLILKEIKKKGIPIIMVTHRMSTTDIADKILLLNNGEVLEYCIIEETVKTSPLISRYLETQKVYF